MSSLFVIFLLGYLWSLFSVCMLNLISFSGLGSMVMVIVWVWMESGSFGALVTVVLGLVVFCTVG